MESVPERLVVVSNRIPITISTENGALTAVPSSGGLVTALEPLLQEHGGIWVGSLDVEETPEVHKALEDATKQESFAYVPVFLTKEEQLNFYQGFSNEIIWPLFHDLQSRCIFDPKYWTYYLQVNQKFADLTRRICRGGDLIWIHDYQLMQLARNLRKAGCQSKLAFFMHIPFPPPDIFAKLPWRQSVMQGLLDHDLIGFQTERDERNFISCLNAFVPEAKVSEYQDGHVVEMERRRTHVGWFPISIDFDGYSKAAADPAVEDKMNKVLQDVSGVRIGLGVDRLDYTKGIPERLRAFASFLRDFPQFRHKVTLFQVVVPSRESIQEYQDLKLEIESLVTKINGEFSQPGWIPINYMHRSIPRDELLALYRSAEVALVTPLKDGMNLVAKEFCAAKIDGEGVLILSEFAGAAPELGIGAILVNPHDEIGVARALNQAFSMDSEEQRERMQRLREQIRQNTILTWRDRLFSRLEAA
jgi:trehalose 6-phosphate synthase/phosphatase